MDHQHRMSAAPGLSRRRLIRTAGIAALGISLAGCGGTDTSPGGPLLNFYTWDTYIGRTTLADFQAQSGVRVQTSYYATNDELFAKLRAGNHGFDVIVPSNEFVTRMRAADMLLALDAALIPNLDNIAPAFRKAAFDPAPRHSAPYTWLVTGIGYRKSRVNGVPDSWRWLFDSDLYKGRIALLSEAADVFRLGARYLGHPVIGLTPDIVRQVEAMLIRQKPNIKAFHEDNGQDLLLAGDVDLVMEFNGDIAQAAAEDTDIGFVVPTEGSLLNADMLAIPAGTARPELAHQFINFLLDAEVGRHIVETILYPTPNAAAKALMPDSYRQNPIIFPTGPGMDASAWGAYEGPAQARLFEEAMTRVRAA